MIKSIFIHQIVCVLQCAVSIPELEPRFFSFNSPIGACEKCHGLGIIHEWPWNAGDPDAWKAKYPDFFGNKYAQEQTCSACYGKRLNKIALAVTLGDEDIYDLGNKSVKDLLAFFENLKAY